MSANPISESVRNFVFEHVDSIEALEILLFFYADPDKSWTIPALACELRSNPKSASSRMQVWRDLKLVQESNASPPGFRYAPSDPALSAVVDELAQHARIQKHKIYELIFSPLKKARDFAEAFRKPDSKDGKNDG